ncbi:MAG: NapC/NirT family cytochrome c [Planctomycetota bacterium]|nr:NapC/NirT family cytochrome c [Planctomycetota bacterium]
MNNLRSILILMTTLLIGSLGTAQDSVWKRTDSDDPYLHRIPLRDSIGRVIDPRSEISTVPHLGKSCAPCHDVEAASGGLHAGRGPDGRRGEPWILVDPRSATHMPLHRRDWPGVRSPESLGLDAENWSQTFGRHETGAGDQSDCFVCHLASGYDFSKRIEQVDSGNPSLAPFFAAGLLDGSGQLDPSRFDSSAQVELNLLGDAGNQTCLRCHTVRNLDAQNGRGWLHQDDVHLAAGLSCVDCHRSGIDHQMVRGYEGEQHPSGLDVTSLSCRGCHLDSQGGAHGAPLPEHRGLPPFHLDEITCTACHSGPAPTDAGIAQWTSRAHRLGESSQKRQPGIAPRIVATSLQPDDQQRIAPYRLTWPDGWGILDATGHFSPLPPSDLRRPLRKALRIRSNLVEELTEKLDTEDSSTLLAGALDQLQDSLQPGQRAVLITGGLAWKSTEDGQLESFTTPLAEAVTWPLSHPVRPARSAVGAGGCTDCHSQESGWSTNELRAIPLLPIGSIFEGPPVARLAVTETHRWSRWSWLFVGREVAKIYFSACAFLAISGGLIGLWKRIQEESR